MCSLHRTDTHQTTANGCTQIHVKFSQYFCVCLPMASTSPSRELTVFASTHTNEQHLIYKIFKTHQSWIWIKNSVLFHPLPLLSTPELLRMCCVVRPTRNNLFQHCGDLQWGRLYYICEWNIFRAFRRNNILFLSLISIVSSGLFMSTSDRKRNHSISSGSLHVNFVDGIILKWMSAASFM